MASRDFNRLTKLAKKRASQMTREEREQQRRSFAYGNGAIENRMITRESVDRAAEKLAKPRKRS